MRFLLAGLFVIACCERAALGAYILDGNRSAAGAYRSGIVRSDNHPHRYPVHTGGRSWSCIPHPSQVA